MMSFDVESLFTNIPLNETINLAVDLIFEKVTDIDISKPQLRKLFVFATKQTHFSFNDILYDQTDGVAMGSPLAPALANLFLGHYENIWLRDQKASKVMFYKRYVDDIFCIFEKEEHFQEFYDFINCQHQNIRFTFEKEENGTIPFLDILINSTPSSFETTTYYKKTYTGLLTNFTSFTSLCYKVGLVRTLVDRAFKINSCFLNFHNNLLKIKSNLQKNGFPLFFIDKHVKNYLDEIHTETNNNISPDTPRFYKLPYIDKYSATVKKHLKDLVSRCCTDDTKIKLIFTPCKLASFFSLVFSCSR